MKNRNRDDPQEDFQGSSSSPLATIMKPKRPAPSSPRHHRRRGLSSPSKKLPTIKIPTSKMRPSLLLLSTVWFALCSCLVWKKQQLSQIFFSFLCCFALGGGMLKLRWGDNGNRRRGSGTAVPAKAVSSAVGVLCCAAALVACRHDPQRGGPYTALSLMAGYLAFDHWYEALRLSMELSWSVVENALTLSVIVVWLATRQDGDGGDDNGGSIKAQAWILYKFTALLLRLANVVSSPSSLRRSPVTPSGRQHSTTAAIVVRQASNETSSIANPPPIPTESSSRLWTIHGVNYDLKEFVARHPGGEQAILLGRGRDCTALFESYHPFTQQHRVVLQRYRAPLGDCLGAASSSSSTSTAEPITAPDEFYQDLCERVAQALRDKGIDPVRHRAATLQRTLYYLVVVGCVLFTGWAHVKGSWWGSLAFAVFGWLLGALGHDAGHFSASRIPFVNDAGVWAMSLLANPAVWQHQHTYAHHSHTNSFAHDPDLHHFETLLRVHRKFPLRDKYRLQSSAAFVVFAWTLVVVGTCFWIPWSVLQSSTLYGMLPVSRPWGMWLHFALYAGVVMVAPFFSHASAFHALLSVLTHMFTSGLLFAFFSQINHLNELSLESPSSSPPTATSWAKAQVETSNNFAPDSYFWHVLSNGLNLQIEHHLFPGLNHCHLHHIAPVVKQVCAEHGVAYKSYGSWREIVQATLDWLDRLSKEP